MTAGCGCWKFSWPVIVTLQHRRHSRGVWKHEAVTWSLCPEWPSAACAPGAPSAPSVWTAAAGRAWGSRSRMRRLSRRAATAVGWVPYSEQSFSVGWSKARTFLKLRLRLRISVSVLQSSCDGLNYPGIIPPWYGGFYGCGHKPGQMEWVPVDWSTTLFENMFFRFHYVSFLQSVPWWVTQRRTFIGENIILLVGCVAPELQPGPIEVFTV